MATATSPPDSPPIDPIANGMGDMGDTSMNLDIETELRDSYLTYAMSVIVSRALPDVRDGLKPVQRRILVAMHDLGLRPSTSTTKCAAIVGETMKRYHPHGDASIYDTLVRLAQDWVLRYRLIHGQGNFGSIAGLPPAAHRYTEAKLTQISDDLLADLDFETVDFIDNYDGKYREPLVLPAKFPNLLVNGSDGIAVGMATDIPPHNLGEVCDGLIALLANPGLSLGELLKIIPGPDFPTGNEIRGRAGVLEGYRSGRGKVTIRARCEVIEEKKGTPAQIIIREVPYQVTRNGLMEQLGEVVKNSESLVKSINEVRDESAPRLGEPVRIVVYLKKGVDPHLILNTLYTATRLQKTVSIIMLALVDGRPRLLSLKEMMQEFLKHRSQVIRRRTEFKLRECKRRSHVLEGQLIAISALDEVIRICRSSPNRDDAKRQLQEMQVTANMLKVAIGEAAFAALQRELGALDVYQMTEKQADAVVRLQLGQLAALERDDIFKEYSGIRGEITEYETLLSDEGNISAIIKSDLEHLKARYADARKTTINDEGGEINLELLIEDEEVIVSLSHAGYVKRMAKDTFRAQARGGKGVKGGARDEDFIEHFFMAKTHDYLLCFTNMGQCYWLKCYELPVADRTSPGRAIANVLTLREGEKIAGIITVREFPETEYLLFCTKNGTVKKTALEAYGNLRKGGIIGLNLEEGDSLIGVVRVKAGDELLLSTKTGMAIRFSEADARPMGRNTTGVKGISLSEGDEVVSLVVADPEGFLMTICENGYGKRTPFGPNAVGEVPSEVPGETEEPTDTPENAEAAENDPSSMRYRLQRRGGKGVRDIKTDERNGLVVAAKAIRDTDDVIIVTVGGQVTRFATDEIRLVGRNTKGVRVVSLSDGDKVGSVATAPHDDSVKKEETETPGGEANVTGTPTSSETPASETNVTDVPPSE